MAELLKFLSSLAPVVQIIIVIGLAIVFWEPIAQKIGWKKNEKDKQEPVPLWAQTLIAHFNHETTEGQNRIEEGINELKESSGRSVRLLEEMKEYGIPCRNDKQ